MGQTQVPVAEWDEATWRAAVGRIRAGRRLAPTQWPGGAKVAVALSFDPDHETVVLRTGATNATVLAECEYGNRVGAGRVLRLLERYAAPATFFMPAVSALLHPAEVRDYAAAGHELAMHGWIHETEPGSPEQERELLLRSADTLEQLSGHRPLGYRTTHDDVTPHTIEVLKELGLTYDSSMMADDDCYELLLDSRPSGMVEVPPDWLRDDAPYFLMGHPAIDIASNPYTPPRQVLGIWIDEFDQARAEGGLFELMMHPHIIGHRSRMVVLDELLRHITASGDVWFATHAQVADHVWRHSADSA